MIVWGSGGDNVFVAPLNEQPCDGCGQHQPFSVVLNYQYFGFYWFFNCVTDRTYYALCDVCRRGMVIDQPEILSKMPAARIPFMRRYGLVVLGIVVAAIGIAAQFDGRK